MWLKRPNLVSSFLNKIHFLKQILDFIILTQLEFFRLSEKDYLNKPIDFKGILYIFHIPSLKKVLILNIRNNQNKIQAPFKLISSHSMDFLTLSCLKEPAFMIFLHSIRNSVHFRQHSRLSAYSGPVLHMQTNSYTPYFFYLSLPMITSPSLICFSETPPQEFPMTPYSEQVWH